MINISSSTWLLRFPVAIILLMHSVPGIFNGGINDLYLNTIGFAPFGLYIAWAIKLSHIVCAICLLLDKYVKWAAITTILILLTGIFLVHLKDGWFVVGGGRNGVEFNFLLIFVLFAILFPKGFKKQGS